jgi:hypothetical protein
MHVTTYKQLCYVCSLISQLRSCKLKLSNYPQSSDMEKASLLASSQSTKASRSNRYQAQSSSTRNPTKFYIRGIWLVAFFLFLVFFIRKNVPVIELLHNTKEQGKSFGWDDVSYLTNKYPFLLRVYVDYTIDKSQILLLF